MGGAGVGGGVGEGEEGGGPNKSGGTDFFSKKLSGGGDVYSGPKSTD